MPAARSRKNNRNSLAIKALQRPKILAPKITEKDIENQILTYLGIVGIFAWKNQSTGLYDPTRKVFRKSNSKHQIKGVSDILGIFNGRMLAIEVKTPKTKNRTTAEQKAFIDMVNSNGGIAFVADSIECVQKELGSHKSA